MRIPSARKIHYESGPNMTPLVDVVMVILIFLMLTGSFAGTEQYLVSNVPIKSTGSGGVPIEKGKIPDQPLEIRVDAQNITGDPTAENFIVHAGRITTSDIDQLTTALTQIHKQMNDDNIPTERIQVQISPNQFVRYQTIIRVYQAALQANFTKVGFTTPH